MSGNAVKAYRAFSGTDRDVTCNVLKFKVYVARQLEHHSLTHSDNLAARSTPNRQLSGRLFYERVFAIEVGLSFGGVDDVDFSRLTICRFDFDGASNHRNFNGCVWSQLILPVDFVSQITRPFLCTQNA